MVAGAHGPHCLREHGADSRVTKAPDDFTVSVITAVFNAGSRVRKSVESAVGLSEVGEIILVEDGSTDDGLTVCRALESEYEKVRVLQHPDRANHGAGASRNLGVERSRFPFIAFLDADDWYLPNRFEADARILCSDPSADGVYNALSNHYESPELRESWLAQGRPDFLTLSGPVPPDQLLSVLLWSHPTVRGEFSTDTITVRKAFFKRVGGFHPGLRLQQDTHLWKRMAAGGRLMPGSLEEPVATRSVHTENRMTRVEDHKLYRELWWLSLRESLCKLGVGADAMQLWRRSYATFRAEEGPRGTALTALASWVTHEPRQLRLEYGHFDLTLRTIFDQHPVVTRLLSFKNRMMGNRRS